jgi:hypothetical protein
MNQNWRDFFAQNKEKLINSATKYEMSGTRKRPAKEALKEEPKKKLMNEVDTDLNQIEDIKNKFNLKIVSFNVAGLRACVKKNCVDYLEKEDADIICLNVSL